MYGVGYIGHPRLETLLKRNNISALGFLNGKEEAKAFEQKRYADLHRSTLRKVDVIAIIAQLAYDGDLKTNASWIEEHGISLESITNIMQNNPVYGLLSILALVMTLATAAWAVF